MEWCSGSGFAVLLNIRMLCGQNQIFFWLLIFTPSEKPHNYTSFKMQCLVFKKLIEDSWMSMWLSQVIQGILCQSVLLFDSKTDTFPIKKKYLNTDSLVNWAVLQTHLSPNVLALCSKVSVLCYDIYLSVFFITCLLEAHTHTPLNQLYSFNVNYTDIQKTKEWSQTKGGIRNTASFNNSMYWDCCNNPTNYCFDQNRALLKTVKLKPISILLY